MHAANVDAGFALACVAMLAMVCSPWIERSLSAPPALWSGVSEPNSDDGDGSDLNEQDIIDIHEAIFAVLFDAPFDPDNWVYPIAEAFVGEGFYTGSNYAGEPYTIEVVHSVLIEPEDGDLDNTADSVIAVVSSDLGVVHLHGYVATRLFESGWETALLPTVSLDPESPMFWPDFEFVDAGAGTDLIVLIQLEAGDAERTECDDDLVQDIAVCADTYDAMVQICNATKIAQDQNAWDGYDDCMRWCGPLFLVCMAACIAGTSGWGSVFCYVACTTVAAACNSTCSSNLNSNLAAATIVHNGCIATAAAIRSGCEQQAENAYDGCKE